MTIIYPETKYFPDTKDNLSDQTSGKASVSETYLEPKPDCEQNSSDEEDSTKPFPFQNNCLFCAKAITLAGPKRTRGHRLTKPQTKENILCALRKKPTPTNKKILLRIQDVDVGKVNAHYHNTCYTAVVLRLGEKPTEGRIKEEKISAAVEKICRYIDKSDRTEFTSAELKNAVPSDDYQPDSRTIAKKLLKKYGEKIYFTRTGRSTIVTVVKDPGLGGSAVIQPWNLNSTDLGGLPEEVEALKNKRKYLKTSTELAVKEKCKKIKQRNIIKAKEKECDKGSDVETISKGVNIEYNNDDNDYIDNIFNSEEYATEDKKNVLCCLTCLSSDRRLEDLGNYGDILRQVGSNVFIHHFEPKVFLICWECLALLKNVKRFQKKIMFTQKLWNSELQEPPKSLSTLSITIPSTASVSCIDENQKDNFEVFPPEAQLIKGEKPVMEDSDMRYSTFDDDTKNVETDVKDFDGDTFNYDIKDVDDDDDNEDSEYEERMRPKLKRRKVQVKRKKLGDSDQDSDVPTKLTEQPKTRKSSSEDPDWGANMKEKSECKKRKKCPKEEKNKIKLKIPYTIIVQAYITETKMKREPIEPHELQYWLDTEINSDYFKELEHKCAKCISEVPDNHYDLWHSEENPFICDICESTFARNDEKESHVANHYYVFSCEFCGYKCYNETHMRGHVETHRRLVQCLECFAAFASFDTLKEHFTNLHRYAECDYCGKQFAHKKTVATHIERNHTPQVCTICYKSYSNFKLKVEHMKLKHRIERTEAAYCVQCDIQFDNVSQFKRHVHQSYKHKHEWKREPRKKVKGHKCPGCPKVYADKFNMKIHYNLVHEKKIKYYCNYCDKAFLTAYGHKQHMRIQHEGYKLPKNKLCNICGRGFSTNVILTNHIRTHTGERPFACPHCASSFAQKVALRSHIAHVHEKRQRTSGEACTKRRQSNAQSIFIDNTV
ncbi:zinc-finger double domain-containing protein [Phthorimaea operculella]|nr:zinc-finger double domain-containing protein [Phthorimaea operculella]